MKYPTTPDGRYFVVGTTLWRCSDPALPADERERWVKALMDARRAVGTAKRSGNVDAERVARRGVDRAKRALGERGDVWWTDGAPDLNRRKVTNTPYRAWYEALGDAPGDARAGDA